MSNYGNNIKNKWKHSDKMTMFQQSLRKYMKKKINVKVLSKILSIRVKIRLKTFLLDVFALDSIFLLRL